MRLLVIEDEKKMAGFLKKGLQESGYSVDVAGSGTAAETLASENDYDLMLLDVMLPDTNGMDVARGIRTGGYKGPILMLTALSSTKDKVRGLDSGADDYLTKPFAFDELLARVRALLRRNETGPESILRFADLEMNLVTRQVGRAQNAIILTPKEFALLEYLMRHPGRPISRTSISEHVWDIHFDSESNVIDVYVNMLRKKIDLPFKNKILHTVVGFGYVLREE
jgi:two-component system copper resistance phosphate regulon response regulator CusR